MPTPRGLPQVQIISDKYSINIRPLRGSIGGIPIALAVSTFHPFFDFAIFSNKRWATMLFLHASNMNDEGEEQKTQIFLTAIDFMHIGCIM